MNTLKDTKSHELLESLGFIACSFMGEDNSTSALYVLSGVQFMIHVDELIFTPADAIIMAYTKGASEGVEAGKNIALQKMSAVFNGFLKNTIK